MIIRDSSFDRFTFLTWRAKEEGGCQQPPITQDALCHSLSMQIYIVASGMKMKNMNKDSVLCLHVEMGGNTTCLLKVKIV